jgi:hypothetical protein
MTSAGCIIKRRLRAKIARNERLVGSEAMQAAELNLGEIYRAENGELRLRPHGGKTPWGRPRKQT